METYKIYVADDDTNLCHLLKSHLVKEGYRVEVFSNGQYLYEAFQREQCHLIITDIMMPVMDGYELCKAIRGISDVPIMMLSAKDEEIDKLLGLELGSDDYISKPFSLREITIKARNMIRRAFAIKSKEEVLTCKNLSINIGTRTVWVNDEEIKVTTREYDFLCLLLNNKNRAFSRDEIIQKVWGYDYVGEARQVDHLIKRLRKKLLLAECEASIETVWGFGYKVSDLS